MFTGRMIRARVQSWYRLLLGVVGGGGGGGGGSDGM